MKALAKIYGIPIWFIHYELCYFNICRDEIPRNIVNIDSFRNGIREHKTIRKLAEYWKCSTFKLREALKTAGIFPLAIVRLYFLPIILFFVRSCNQSYSLLGSL